MALDDIVFSDGDKQNIIGELPLGTLESPLDILLDAYARTVQTLPLGMLGTPLDWLEGSMTANEVMLYELVLSRENSFAFVL